MLVIVAAFWDDNNLLFLIEMSAHKNKEGKKVEIEQRIEKRAAYVVSATRLL